MDNLSHSLSGLAVAELIQRSLPAERDLASTQLRRRLLYVSCGLASNFPDLDLVLTPLLPQPLGYLLHHRGHTHTFLYSVPQALLLMILIWLLWPRARRLLRQSSAARRAWLFSISLGFIFHLAMDSLNSYGIHPFYPFDASWYFGDMTFILEPFFWMAFGAPLIFAMPSGKGKILLATFLSVVPLLLTMGGYLPMISLGCLLLVALTIWELHRRWPERRRTLVFSFVFTLFYVGLQGALSGNIKQRIQKDLAAADVLDVAVNSYPANPFCWDFVHISKDEKAGTYSLVKGIYSLFPQFINLSSCSHFLSKTSVENTGQNIYVVKRFDGSLSEIREKAADNCYFNAWMRFSRAPMMDGELAEDLRFARLGLRGGFTLLDMTDFKKSCPQNIPPWDFPRADLLKEKL